MTLHPWQRSLGIGLFLAAAILNGCGSEDPIISPPLDQAPESNTFQSVTNPSARGSFPLETGSRWEYRRTFELRFEYLNAVSPAPGEVYEASVERTIIGTERIAGQDYAIEEMVIGIPGQDLPIKRWTRFREDHAGLYVADVPVTWPPGATIAATASGRGSSTGRSIDDAVIPGWNRIASQVDASVAGLTRSAWKRHTRGLSEIHAMLDPGNSGVEAGGGAIAMEMTGRPGGLLPEEFLWLLYPPHPKTRWIQRRAPFRIVSEVEAHESLDLPAGRFAAYRVRIENSLLGEDDRVTVWFGRCGRLGFDIHKETVALDIDTGEMVRISSDEIEVLTHVDLAEPGRCSGGPDTDE